MGFYNQITIYGVHNDTQMSVLKEIVVTEVQEDLVTACYCAEEGLFAFGGALSVGYIYNLSGPKVARAVTIAIDDDDDSAPLPEGLVRLNGHFKQIDQMAFRPLEATRAFGQTPQLLTGSQDFSVRLWDTQKGIQLALFLDVNTQNSEILSLAWDQSGFKFLSLDTNQSLKVWDLHKPAVQDHLARARRELPNLDPYKDYVLMQHFPAHSLFQVLNLADSARFFGANSLVMLKSPLSGLCVIELLQPRDEERPQLGFGESDIIGSANVTEQSQFQVVRTYSCEQLLLSERSDFTLLGRYAYLGGQNNTIHQVDLLAQEPNKVLKVGVRPTASVSSTAVRNCDLISLVDICN